MMAMASFSARALVMTGPSPRTSYARAADPEFHSLRHRSVAKLGGGGEYGYGEAVRGYKF
jgi:hypothetical protein